MKNFTKKILSSVLTASVLVSTFLLNVSADEAYYGYNYGWWGDPVYSQNGYIVEDVISGRDLGLDRGFNEPNDMFVFEKTGEIFIADSKNNRIVITDADLDSTKTETMDKFYFPADYAPDPSKAGTETTLNNPMGVFVLDDDGTQLIYIADHSNDRVLACYENGEVWMEYLRPDSSVYDSAITFNPRKIIVDGAKNVYVCVKSITRGAIVFAKDGSFNSYYGANKVEATSDVILRQFYRLFMTREQLLKMRRIVPTEFSNFDIDDDGFIFTVTELKSADVDVVKKLNPAGVNVLENLGLDDYFFGDWGQIWANNQTWKSSIVDVEVDDKNNVLLLDFTMGRVFQYNEEFDLLFIFGGKGEQKGTFTSPTALETYGGKVYVLDGRKNTITVFKRTEFGAIVHNALDLYVNGYYLEAKEPFEDVLRRDSNYWAAYIGLGNAYLTLGEFETAMDYFYMNARGGYNMAFKDYRIQFIRKNFNTIIIFILAVVIILVVINTIIKRRRKKKEKESIGG